MVKRLKTSVAGIVLLVGILLLSHTAVFNIAAAVMAVLALNEIGNVVLKNKKPELMIVSYIFVASYQFSEFLPTITNAAFVYVFMIVLFLILLARHECINFKDVALMFTFSYLICVPLATIVAIRRMVDGVHLVYLVFMIPWVTDTFAYIFGSIFGKHKLCPSISPNKTVEGSVFGLIGGMASVMIFAIIMRFGFNRQIVNLIPLALVGLVCSLVGQIGDLSESIIKRQIGVKDFGNIFPGHGGVMDRFDSVFFVAPVLFYFLSTVQFIV